MSSHHHPPEDASGKRLADRPTHGIRREEIQSALEHAIHYLPSQGPIAIFVHHNTLHAFEHLPFEEAVVAGWNKYHSQPYLSEERFRKEYTNGRIIDADIDEVLKSDLGDNQSVPVILDTNRFQLRRMMLGHVIRNGPDQELLWFMAETNALDKFRRDIPAPSDRNIVESVKQWLLRHASSPDHASSPIDQTIESIRYEVNRGPLDTWSHENWCQLSLRWLHRVCREGAGFVGEVTTDEISVHRHRDVLLGTCQFDCDLRVLELLVRFLASFTDQGFAQWTMPNRSVGIY